MDKMERIDDYVAQLASDVEQVSKLEFSFADLRAPRAQLLDATPPPHHLEEWIERERSGGSSPLISEETTLHLVEAPSEPPNEPKKPIIQFPLPFGRYLLIIPVV